VHRTGPTTSAAGPRPASCGARRIHQSR
jgi:hypothetical protein